MTMAPAPMMRIFLRSVRFLILSLRVGRVSRRGCSQGGIRLPSSSVTLKGTSMEDCGGVGKGEGKED